MKPSGINELRSGVYLSWCGKYLAVFRNCSGHYELTTPVGMGNRVSWKRLLKWEYLGRL